LVSSTRKTTASLVNFLKRYKFVKLPRKPEPLGKENQNSSRNQEGLSGGGFGWPSKPGPVTKGTGQGLGGNPPGRRLTNPGRSPFFNFRQGTAGVTSVWNPFSHWVLDGNKGFTQPKGNLAAAETRLGLFSKPIGGFGFPPRVSPFGESRRPWWAPWVGTKKGPGEFG